MPKLDETLKSRARNMRTNQTPAETRLWHLLRAHHFSAMKFSRQVVVAPYILDFAARSRKIAIEVDGDTHGETFQYDAARTAFLESKGYRVMRFTNAEVMGNIEGVADIIGAAISTSAPLPGQFQVNSAPRCSGYAGGITDLKLPRGEREEEA